MVLLMLMAGVASTATINVPGDQGSIQAGLNAAIFGDTVLVAPGTYNENITWPEVNGIKLIASGDTSDTFIDGMALDRVLLISSASIDTNTVISGFTIQNGLAENGAGIKLANNSAPKLTHLLITDNNTPERYNQLHIGGGIYCINSSPTLNHVAVRNNFASNSGGGISCDNSSPLFNEVVIYANSANFNGGGIYCENNSSPSLKYVTIKANTAFYGGGIYCDESSPILTDVFIINNAANNSGGGIHCEDNSSAFLTNVTISANTASSGAGIYFDESSPILTDVFITDNTAGSFGGGSYCKRSSPTLSRVTIAGNSASEGGAFYCVSTSSSPSLTEVTIINNNATVSGDGIWARFATPSISNSNICNPGVAILNDSDDRQIIATNNWWGDASGPYEPSSNPGGLGDTVSTNVTFEPFLTTPNIDAPPIPPLGLTSANVSDTSVEFRWDTSPLSDFESFHVYFDTDSWDYPYANNINVGSNTSHTLSDLLPETEYFIAVTVLDTDGNESCYSYLVANTNTTTIHEILSSQTPIEYEIASLYPNPFNPTLTAIIGLPMTSDLKVVVYNVMGQEVAELTDRQHQAGYHNFIFDGSGLSSGVYFIQAVVSGKFNQIQKIVLMK